MVSKRVRFGRLLSHPRSPPPRPLSRLNPIRRPMHEKKRREKKDRGIRDCVPRHQLSNSEIYHQILCILSQKKATISDFLVLLVGDFLVDQDPSHDDDIENVMASF